MRRDHVDGYRISVNPDKCVTTLVDRCNCVKFQLTFHYQVFTVFQVPEGDFQRSSRTEIAFLKGGEPVADEPSGLSDASAGRTGLSITTVEPAAPGGIEVQLLGPVEAKLAGELVPLAGARQISVLAALALGVGRVVTMARLTHAVWDGVPPPTARAQVQAAVLRLRRWLPGIVRTTAHGYLLAAAGWQVDAEVFRELSAQAWAGVRDRRPAEAAVLFRSALGLWRGTALDGVTGLGADAAKLEEQRVSAVAGLFAAELDAGRHREILPDLYGHVVKLPWHESLRALLMLALYRCGREAEALTAYRDGCRLLAEQLGAEPGSGLRKLVRAIRAHDPRLAAPALPALTGLAGTSLRAFPHH
jgi:DNA-binding SARP family transcriptional activator